LKRTLKTVLGLWLGSKTVDSNMLAAAVDAAVDERPPIHSGTANSGARFTPAHYLELASPA
jgi:hypothetical protein